MMGFFIDGKRAPGMAVVWEGGQGFLLRRFRIPDGYNEVVISGEPATEVKLNMRKKMTPDNVQEHVNAIFDRLAREEIKLIEPSE
ncbi:hypothetical protein ABZX93_05360 [Streptomyces sp. NPDC006632]|uniref:hypothetical protein n=1 Tax=Streptomyces sp. NPDC006632 TaxID=3157182 RepID=UPI0033A3738A